jgi:hypothetical protein
MPLLLCSKAVAKKQQSIRKQEKFCICFSHLKNRLAESQRPFGFLGGASEVGRHLPALDSNKSEENS